MEQTNSIYLKRLSRQHTGQCSYLQVTGNKWSTEDIKGCMKT